MNGRSHTSKVMREVSAYIAGALKHKLPDEVRARAKIHLIDTFAAMVSGSRLLPGKRALAYLEELGGAGKAGVVGVRNVTSVPNAALANGMFGHAGECDDTHPATRSHPGISVIPAALALAEHTQASGKAMLHAIVAGYEICVRVLAALDQRQLLARGFIPPPHGGVFGAGAAGAALLKLNPQRVAHVLSYCAQQAAGLATVMRDAERIEKAYVIGGMPAQNGVAAVLMVKRGFSGVNDVFAGNPNHLTVYSPTPDSAVLVTGLGKDYELLRCSIKYWPAAAPVQGALHVLRDLIRMYQLNPQNVHELVARLPDKDLEMVDNRDMPEISIQHLLAMMLVDGDITSATVHNRARMSDPRVLAVRKNCIRTVGDPELTDPLRRWRCVMEVTLKDGRKIKHQTMAAKGSFENPLTREEVADKAMDLMGPILGKQRSQKLIDALESIERIDDVRKLRRLYQGSVIQRKKIANATRGIRAR